MCAGMIVFYSASVYYFFVSKSELAALALLAVFLLQILTCICACLSDKPKAAHICLVISCTLVVTMLAYGVFYSAENSLSPRQLFYAMVPLMGYLLTFVLALVTPAEKISEKSVGDG